MGFSIKIPQRVKAQRAGCGAPLLAAVTKRGIPWRKLRTWQRKDGFFEQHLKRAYTNLHNPGAARTLIFGNHTRNVYSLGPGGRMSSGLLTWKR